MSTITDVNGNLLVKPPLVMSPVGSLSAASPPLTLRSNGKFSFWWRRRINHPASTPSQRSTLTYITTDGKSVYDHLLARSPAIRSGESIYEYFLLAARPASSTSIFCSQPTSIFSSKPRRQSSPASIYKYFLFPAWRAFTSIFCSQPATWDLLQSASNHTQPCRHCLWNSLKRARMPSLCTWNM